MSFGLWLLILSRVKSAGSLPLPSGKTVKARVFLARNLVKELNPDGNTVVITGKTNSHYLAAATMLFEVKDFKDLGDLPRGDEIAYRLHVANTERQGISKHRDRRNRGSIRPISDGLLFRRDSLKGRSDHRNRKVSTPKTELAR